MAFFLLTMLPALSPNADGRAVRGADDALRGLQNTDASLNELVHNFRLGVKQDYDQDHKPESEEPVIEKEAKRDESIEADQGRPMPSQELGIKGYKEIARNIYRANQEWEDHGGMISANIPREAVDREVGTNAWPVPSWWNRVPGWWDVAPTWWEKQTQQWANRGQISGQPEASFFNAVN